MDLVGIHPDYPSVPFPDLPDDRCSFSQICIDIVTGLGHAFVDFFREGVKVVGHRVNKAYFPETYQRDVERCQLQLNSRLNAQLNKQFCQNLTSISSVPQADEKHKLTVNLFDRKELISILEGIKKDAEADNDKYDVLSELTLLLRILRASQAEHLNIQEKEKVWLSFVQLAKNTQTAPTDLAYRQIIDDKKLSCELQYLESFRAEVAFEIAQDLKKDWQLGYVRSTSYKGSLGAATPLSKLGVYASVSACGAYENTGFVDPEGYWNEYQLAYGGVRVDAEASFGSECKASVAGVEVEVSAKAQAYANASIQGICGTFREPKTPLAWANRNFDTLIQERKYRQHPKIAPYLSRARLATFGGDSQLVDVLETLKDIESIRQEFRSRKKAMNKRLDDYMDTHQAEKQVKAKFKAARVQALPDEVTEATITGWVGKLSIGGEFKLAATTKLDVGTEAKAGVGVGLAVVGSGEAMLRYRDEVKYTPIGERYADPIRSESEKKDLKRQIEARCNEFKNRLINREPAFKLEKPGDLQKCFAQLEKDFKDYKAQPSATIRNYYGAANPEQLLHRLQIASLYLLIRSDDEQLNEAILKFEQKLLSPPFAVNKNYLNEHLYFIEDLRISLFEAKFELETKAQAFAVATTKAADHKTETETGVHAKAKVIVTYQDLSGHTNILRTGQSLQLSVTAGVGINVQETIEAIAPDFHQQLPSDLAESALAQLKEKLLFKISAAASYTKEITFDFYVAKPNKFTEDSTDFAWRHYFSRETLSDVHEVKKKETIPAALFDVICTGEYLDISTDPLREFCESNTIFQFAILAMHLYHDGGTNKVTGASKEWEAFTKRHQAALKKFFINFAKESNFEQDKTPKGAISHGIFEMEKAIERNKENYRKQLWAIYKNEQKLDQLAGDLNRYNFAAARDNFKRAAQNLNNLGSDSNYQTALQSFNNLLHAYYPQWAYSKATAKGLKARPLAAIEGGGSVEKRRQAANMSLAGIMMQYG